MTKDKERDDALIAEKKRLADILEKKAGNAYYAITSVDLRQAAALLRGDEQPKPDRAEVLVHELWIMDSGPSQSVWLEVVRRHFTELRAEWEAERQDEPVCFIGKVDCDGNELVTVSKDALDRYKDQARYTYQRAEKAEARVKKLEAERPAVVVPMSAKMWAESVLNLRGAINATCEREAARFILSLDGAKGGE